MSCDSNDSGRKHFRYQKSPKKGNKGYHILTAGILTVCFLYYGVLVSLPWNQNSASTPKRVWEQLPGNDGKAWEGMPDTSIYADKEGIKCTTYSEYHYDRAGRLSTVDLYRKSDSYNINSDNIWFLTQTTVYEYDSQGRVLTCDYGSGRSCDSYTYFEGGYTVESVSSYNGKIDTFTYDDQGNLLASRVTQRYSPGYERETTQEYDEKGRRVKSTLKIGKGEPYVNQSITYDDETNTSVERSYSASGELTCICINTYDDAGRKIGDTWCETAKLPQGMAVEDCVDFYTIGYWADYHGELLMEELENESSKYDFNSSYYRVYDYDAEGNCVLELRVWDAGYFSMCRYVYDKQGRKIEKYDYNCSEATEFERRLIDGSVLRINCGGEDGTPLSVTRTCPDGELINQFVYGDYSVEMQYTPEETIYWQRSPALLAQKEEIEKPSESESGQGESVLPEQKPILYIVRPGDCLWRIAERYLGEGRLYMKIYRWNEEVIGDDPGLILPGMELYIEATEDEKRGNRDE
ncbi:MAG: LysM peptidoglycan-binding domain-containing protein, partial [Acetatifactor sp.]|nr:LysM peptidoglycan-binding domain-containing protein [Acetatifactor sp.]